MEFEFNSVTEAWSVLYDDLGNNSVEHEIENFYQSKPRGRLCNEVIGLSIEITDPVNCLMYSPVRKLPPTYLAKEHLWYNGGSRVPDLAPAKVWSQLANEDGPDKGLINSNYGAYIFAQKDNKYPSLSVWDATIDLLKRDPDSRQAILQIPIIPHRQDKDTPCTSTLHFLLRDGKLNCVTYMRSCDCWFGFPNDITNFILWQMRMAKALDVELGWYKHIFGSFHVYEENFIKSHEQYGKDMDSFIEHGREGVPYFKFYEDRDYRIVLDEILSDFELLANNSKDEIRIYDIKNEQLRYMFENMAFSNFKN